MRGQGQGSRWRLTVTSAAVVWGVLAAGSVGQSWDGATATGLPWPNVAETIPSEGVAGGNGSVIGGAGNVAGGAGSVIGGAGSMAGETGFRPSLRQTPLQPGGTEPSLSFFKPDGPVFYLDYRVRSVSDSHTSYEFGTPELPPEGWTPLSRLIFPLDSFWHGVEAGVETPTWAVRVEWLTPMQSQIQGDLEDYDWYPPNPDSSFTDLGVLRQRWTDAQMLDLEAEFRLLDRPLGLPFSVWPTGGFRWQRFGIMTYDAFQLKEGNVWPIVPWSYYGDVIAFKQQYYTGYVGGQLRSTIENWSLPPLRLTLQADWGWVDAFNVDHHLIREGDRYTKESTHGDSWHTSLVAEMLLRRRLSVGFEVDYLQIRTTGRHRLLNIPEDQDLTWDHGVRAWSDQTWLTAFLRLRI